MSRIDRFQLPAMRLSLFLLIVSTAGTGSAQLRDQAAAAFGALPESAASAARPMTDARVELGRMLYYDARLSKNHDIACNSCHQLDAHGVDGQAFSPGHRGQLGGRNSPTSYNAALHIAQFWDGRAADVEAQAKGPILNPIEMAMPSEEAVLAVLNSIPGYGPLFDAAFPGESPAISYDNMATAIGAFERGLVTPGDFDRYLGGDQAALEDAEKEGLSLFLAKGCTACHNGALVGGGMYQKLGLIEPYPTKDVGRSALTGKSADEFFFKVPSLRNVAETGPYFHDGSIASLDEAVRLMGIHQLGIEISEAERAAIAAFLGSLTGEIDAAYVARPELPASGPTTPAPDPS